MLMSSWHLYWFPTYANLYEKKDNRLFLMFRWALRPFNQIQLKIEMAAHFKVQRSLVLFELDDSFVVSRLHLKTILH